MQTKTNNLFNLVSNLEIDEEIKTRLLTKIWNEEFTDEFFEELEWFLNFQIEEENEKIKNFEEKEKEVFLELKNEKEKNKIKKQEILENQRAELKEIYQDSKRDFSKLEWEMDEFEEVVSNEEENSEVNDIKKMLEI